MANTDWLNGLRVRRGDLEAFSEPLRASLLRIYEHEFGRTAPEELGFSTYWKKLEVTSFYDSKDRALAEIVKKGEREFGMSLYDRKISVSHYLGEIGVRKDDLRVFPLGMRIWVEEVLKDHFPLHWQKDKEIPLNRIYHLLAELKTEHSREYHRSFDLLLETEPSELGRAIVNRRQEQDDNRVLKMFSAIAVAAVLWFGTANYRVKADPDAQRTEARHVEERIRQKMENDLQLRRMESTVAAQIIGKLPYETRQQIVQEADGIVRRVNAIEALFVNFTPADKARCDAAAKEVFSQYDQTGQSLDRIFEMVHYKRFVPETGADGKTHMVQYSHLATPPKTIEEFAQKLHESGQSLPSARMLGQNYLAVTRKTYVRVRNTLKIETPSQTDLETLAMDLMTARDEQGKFFTALRKFKEQSSTLAKK